MRHLIGTGGISSDIPSISLSSPNIYPFGLEPNYLPFCPRRSYSFRNRRSALFLLARMHSFPFCPRVTCVLAERLRSALQVLGSRSAYGRHSLIAPPPRSHPTGASSPPPVPAPRPPLAILYIVGSFPARPGWSP
eukprot:1830763-Pleurochrysis_carterae.AAC.2